jgi:hypothetical protein
VNYLAPNLNLTPFTEDEDEKILFYVKMYGTQWKRFIYLFPGRTDIHLKNRYTCLKGKRYQYKLAQKNQSFQFDLNFESYLNLTDFCFDDDFCL